MFIDLRAQAVIVLFLYDYLLTLPLEVELVWKTKFRTSTLLYLLTHSVIASLVFNVVADPTTPQVDLRCI
jgi:hypothetical protein